MATRITILCCILLCGLGCSSPPPTTSISIDIAGETFNLELMINQEARTKGMMHRTSISPSGGMLFIFPDSKNRSFWMKNCFVDIDLIFLDSRGLITSLYEMTMEPPQEQVESIWAYEGRLNHYWSKGPARFAIELAPGSIHRLHLEINDKIILDLPYLKSLAR